MRVIVDTEKCSGAGQCVMLAPKVFDQRDDGIVIRLDPSPPAALHHAEFARHGLRTQQGAGDRRHRLRVRRSTSCDHPVALATRVLTPPAWIKSFTQGRP